MSTVKPVTTMNTAVDNGSNASNASSTDTLKRQRFHLSGKQPKIAHASGRSISYVRSVVVPKYFNKFLVYW